MPATARHGRALLRPHGVGEEASGEEVPLPITARRPLLNAAAAGRRVGGGGARGSGTWGRGNEFLGLGFAA